MFRPLMSRNIRLAFSLLALCLVWPVPHTCRAALSPARDYGHLPLYFMENRGQVNPEVQYFTQGSGFALGFTPKGPIFSLHPATGRPQAPGEYLPPESLKGGSRNVSPGGSRKPMAAKPPVSVRMIPLGMNQTAAMVPGELQAGTVNYFLGKDPKKWRTGIPTYQTVVYREAYPGIDLKFYGSGRHLEYDIIVRPDADYRQVKFRCTGIKALHITPKGDLSLTLPCGRDACATEYYFYEGNLLLVGRPSLAASRWRHGGPPHRTLFI